VKTGTSRTQLGYFLLVLAGVLCGVGAALVIREWWRSRPPEGTRELCRSYVMLMHNGRCIEAQKLTTFAGGAAYCSQYGKTYSELEVECSSGEWQADAYIWHGQLRARGQAPQEFVVWLGRRHDQWRVIDMQYTYYD
jgi:hypothetical protein